MKSVTVSSNEYIENDVRVLYFIIKDLCGKCNRKSSVFQDRKNCHCCSLVIFREVFFVSEGHRKPETYRANLCDQHKFCASRSVLLKTA